MKKALLSLTAIVSSSMFITGVTAQAAEMPQRAYLNLDTAQQLANAAMAKCSADGYSVSVSVVDASGLTRVQLRADNAGPHTLESSRKKAFTSASMGRPTADFAKMIAEKPFLAGLRDMDPNLLLLGGGLPIKSDGKKVGGIGVGGAPGGHLDSACAQAAIDKVLGK
ncbi:MAG: heme-binding protein [Motiliproteus sp.]